MPTWGRRQACTWGRLGREAEEEGITQATIPSYHHHHLPADYPQFPRQGPQATGVPTCHHPRRKGLGPAPPADPVLPPPPPACYHYHLPPSSLGGVGSHAPNCLPLQSATWKRQFEHITTTAVTLEEGRRRRMPCHYLQGGKEQQARQNYRWREGDTCLPACCLPSSIVVVHTCSDDDDEAMPACIPYLEEGPFSPICLPRRACRPDWRQRLHLPADWQ